MKTSACELGNHALRTHATRGVRTANCCAAAWVAAAPAKPSHVRRVKFKLELYLKPALELPRHVALCRNLAEAGTSDRSVRRRELRRIEEVVAFRPELDLPLAIPNGRAETLHHYSVYVASEVAAHIGRPRSRG